MVSFRTIKFVNRIKIRTFANENKQKFNYMKKILMLLAVAMISVTAAFAQVDKIVGEWKTVDDKTGKAVSVSSCVISLSSLGCK